MLLVAGNSLLVITTVFAIFSLVPFIALGRITVEMFLFGWSPQAWLSGLLPVIFLIGLLTRFFVNGEDRRPQGLPAWQSRLNNTILLSLPIWAAIQWVNFFAISERSVGGLQSVLVATVFSLGVLFFYFNPVPYRQAELFLAGLGTIGALISVLEGWAELQPVNREIPSAYLLVPLVYALQVTRRYPLSYVAPLIILQAIIMGGSRMNLIVALFLMLSYALFALGREALYRIGLLAGAGIVTVLNFLFVDSLRARWGETGDGGIVLPSAFPGSSGEINLPESGAVLVLNSNGRARVWSELVAQVDPLNALFGNGAGFSRSLVERAFGWDQPHNEYLRLLLDFGLLGLSLWLGILFLLFLAATRRWSSHPIEGWVLAAIVFCVAMLSLTDIPMVSLGVMLPAAFAVAVQLNLTRGVKQVGPRTTPPPN